jgi:hypothetical protein
LTIEEYFPIDEVESWKTLLRNFHGKLLLDGTLSDSRALLICLYMVSNKNHCAEVSYDEVRALFLEFGRKEPNFRVNLYNLKKAGLVREKGDGAKLLSLTFNGLSETKELIGEPNICVIEAGKVYSGKKRFEDVILSKIGVYLKICDPYCGTRTLDILSRINHKCEVELLTQNIEKTDRFRRDFKDFRKEFPDIDVAVRIFSMSVLHDRYLVTDKYCWSVGSSLKDFGNKDTIITLLGDEIKSGLEELFEKRWNEAVPF